MNDKALGFSEKFDAQQKTLFKRPVAIAYRRKRYFNL